MITAVTQQHNSQKVVIQYLDKTLQMITYWELISYIIIFFGLFLPGVFTSQGIMKPSHRLTNDLR